MIDNYLEYKEYCEFKKKALYEERTRRFNTRGTVAHVVLFKDEVHENDSFIMNESNMILLELVLDFIKSESAKGQDEVDKISIVLYSEDEYEEKKKPAPTSLAFACYLVASIRNADFLNKCNRTRLIHSIIIGQDLYCVEKSNNTEFQVSSTITLMRDNAQKGVAVFAPTSITLLTYTEFLMQGVIATVYNPVISETKLSAIDVDLLMVSAFDHGIGE